MDFNIRSLDKKEGKEKNYHFLYLTKVVKKMPNLKNQNSSGMMYMSFRPWSVLLQHITGLPQKSVGCYSESLSSPIIRFFFLLKLLCGFLWSYRWYFTRLTAVVGLKDYLHKWQWNTEKCYQDQECSKLTKSTQDIVILVI